VAAAERAGDQGTARTALCEAVEEYRGDLLPALYDDWVLVERQRLLQRFLTALERLILLLEQAGEYAAAIGHTSCCCATTRCTRRCTRT
jgi:DNA-binding SARP family transcriptional activator